MAKKPGTNPKGEFVFFDVVYEDGSQRSNRRVPAELLGGLEKDAPALGFLIEQDREIAEKSGRVPLKIDRIARVGAKPEKMMRTGERSCVIPGRAHSRANPESRATSHAAPGFRARCFAASRNDRKIHRRCLPSTARFLHCNISGRA
jgi:hypothetical protein